MNKKIIEMTAREIANLVISKEITALEVVNSFIENVEKRNHEINAFLRFDKSYVIQQAKEIDKLIAKGINPGLLAGVPIAIKDNIHVKGLKTTCASKILENYEPGIDASAVSLLLKEGAIIMGKTNMDEFAMGSHSNTSYFGAVKNPWDTELSPGGSSGGSAAAVASGMCCIALGTDTGGSVRQPAALTGLFGYKSSFGGISRHGIVPLASSLDQIGIFSHNIDDIWLIARIIGKKCNKDMLCIGIKNTEEENLNKVDKIKIITPSRIFLEEDIYDIYNSALKKISEDDSISASTSRIESLKLGLPTYMVICCSEIFANMSRFDGSIFGHREDKNADYETFAKKSRALLGNTVKNRIIAGNLVITSKGKANEDCFKMAIKAKNLLTKELNLLLESYDVIITPTTPYARLRSDEALKDYDNESHPDTYTTISNLTSLPALNIVCGYTKNGTPVGMHLISSRNNDKKLLEVAKSISKILNLNYNLPRS